MKYLRPRPKNCIHFLFLESYIFLRTVILLINRVWLSQENTIIKKKKRSRKKTAPVDQQNTFCQEKKRRKTSKKIKSCKKKFLSSDKSTYKICNPLSGVLWYIGKVLYLRILKISQNYILIFRELTIYEYTCIYSF